MPAKTATAAIEKLREDYLTLRQHWALEPEWYCRRRLGLNPTVQQRRILKAIAGEGARVSVRSGHGIGKTGILAATILWFLETRDYAKVPCTAPTASQLFSALWGELGKWMRKADMLSRRRGIPSPFWLSRLFRLTHNRLADVGSPLEWYAIARTARKEQGEALQGFHATGIDIDADGERVDTASNGKILVVVDEASGVPDEIFEVLEGILASPGARLLMASNATRLQGHFYHSHTRGRGFYTTLHFSSQNSPLVSPGYRQTLVDKFGENSSVVRVRADGEFPIQDEETLIPLPIAEEAICRQPGGERQGIRRLGVDPARAGRTAMVLRQGTHVPHSETYTGQNTMATVGHVLHCITAWEADEVYVDVIGIGAGVFDRLQEITVHDNALDETVRTYMHKRGWHTFPVYAVNVSKDAPKREKGKLQARKLRDYLWLEMADWLREETPALTSAHKEDLAGELATPKYQLDSSGRIVIESKDSMRERLLKAEAVSSPDLADALGLTFAPAPKRPLVQPLAMGQTNAWRL